MNQVSNIATTSQLNSYTLNDYKIDTNFSNVDDKFSNVAVSDLTNMVEPLLVKNNNLDKLNNKLSNGELTLLEANDNANEISHYQDQVSHVLGNSLTKDELSHFDNLKSTYANNFNEIKHNMLTNNSQKSSQLVQNIQDGLTMYSNTSTISHGDNITDMANNGNLSFFALLITVMLFGYNATSEYGKLMLLKQKNAQGAAAGVTELQKMLLELKDLVGDDKNGCKNLYDLFSKAYGSSPDKNIKARLDKYKDTLSQIKDPITGDSYMSKMVWDGDYCDSNFLLMMNGYITSVNKNLTNNGVAESMTIQTFDTKDPAIPYDSEDTKKVLNTYFETNGKNCETCSSQLTTINQNIQASVSQATETVKSLLEWLKQSIQGYGTSINPR